MDGDVGTSYDDLARLALERSGLRASLLIDPELVIRWASPHVERLLGWAGDAMVGRSALGFLHPDDVASAAGILTYERHLDAATRSATRQRNVREVRVLTEGGEFVAQEASLSNFFADPDIGMMLIDLQAPSQYRHADRAIELSRVGADIREILAIVLTALTAADPDGIAGAVFDDSGIVLAATSLAPSPVGAGTAADYLSAWDLDLTEAGSAERVGVLRVWSHLRTPHPVDIESSERVARHAAVVIGRDRAMQDLRRAALHDPLTGVANRRALEDEVRSRHGRGEHLLVAYLDLDGFKAVNDSLGHDAGDQVLVTIANRLRASLRGTDVVTRVGGDEFVLLFTPPVPSPDALRDRLSLAISAPVVVGGEVVSITASIGFSQGPADIDTLLRAADAEMLAHKRRR